MLRLFSFFNLLLVIASLLALEDPEEETIGQFMIVDGLLWSSCFITILAIILVLILLLLLFLWFLINDEDLFQN